MTKICALDDIAEGDSIGVTAEIAGQTKMLIVVRQSDQVYVYLNSCPHIGAPLDLQPGKFLSHDKSKIICSTHGALFEIASGHCTFGPCKDDQLEVLPIYIKNGDVFSQA